MRIKIKVNGKLVGDYTEDAMQTMERLITALKLHLTSDWQYLEIKKYNESKAKQRKKEAL